jgi:hypothetical protein
MKIVKIFSRLYNVKPEDLLVSFDGMSCYLPIWENSVDEITPYFHIDQSFLKKGFHCVQSWINGYDTNPGDSTLAFLEQSHKYFEELGENFDILSTSDYHNLSDVETDFLKHKGCIESRVICPKGSLVLWDSRLAHCGLQPTIENPSIRCAVYLCYQPREFSDEKQLKLKRRAFNSLRSTSHWPCKVWLFPQLPIMNNGEVIKNIEPPILNDLGKKLAGF